MLDFHFTIPLQNAAAPLRSAVFILRRRRRGACAAADVLSPLGRRGSDGAADHTAAELQAEASKHNVQERREASAQGADSGHSDTSDANQRLRTSSLEQTATGGF